MQLHKLTHIRYRKILSENKEEITTRWIVPMAVPSSNIKAIDLTEYSASERDQAAKTIAEYAQYVQLQQQKIFSFEDWLEHTTNQKATNVKWRTFKSEQTQEL